MNLFAVIPVKPFAEGKSRLKEILSDHQRSDLNLQMFDHVLSITAATIGPANTIVVSPEQTALEMARNTGAIAVREETRAGLNSALILGAATAQSTGADALLILPTDLPTLSQSDLEAILNAAGHSPFVVIAPDRLKQGTNALLMSPLGIIGFSFGKNSFSVHRETASAAQIEPVIVHRDGLAFDIDMPEDYRQLKALQLKGGENKKFVGE